MYIKKRRDSAGGIAPSPGLKWPECEAADHSPPDSVEDKKMWIYTSTPHMSSWDIYLSCVCSGIQLCHIVQVVSCWLPTVVARIQAQVRPCEKCGSQGTRADFFPSTSVSPVNFYSTDCSIIIIRGWYSRPNSGRQSSRLSLTPPQEMAQGEYCFMRDSVYIGWKQWLSLFLSTKHLITSQHPSNLQAQNELLSCCYMIS
jgi:hypothetical protein